MKNSDTELIYPLRVTQFVIEALDNEWKKLTETIISKNADRMDQLGFVLTMAKLAGCVSCNSDSFRAMRGCTQCAIQTIRRQHLKGTDLRVMFEQNRLEAEFFFKNRFSEAEPIDLMGTTCSNNRERKNE